MAGKLRKAWRKTPTIKSLASKAAAASKNYHGGMVK